MTARAPLVANAGQVEQLQSGDTLSGYLGVISTNTTYYIATAANGGSNSNSGSSGSPWLTLDHAISYLQGYWIAPSATVTITIGNGTYSLSGTVAISHPCASRIVITGTNTYTTTTSSVSSSGGSSPNWTYVLNVGSSANVATNDYVIIYGASGGGVDGIGLQGCWKVTSVSTGKIGITTSGVHMTTVASGAVVANVIVFKTILSYAGHIISVTDGTALGIIENLVLAGTTAGDGLYCTNGSYIGTAILGCSGCNNGFYANQSVINSGTNVTACSSSVAAGYNCQNFGFIYANNAQSSGNGTQGFNSQFGASMQVASSYSIGNTSDGYFASDSGSIYAGSASSWFNGGNGFWAFSNGFIDCGSGASWFNTSAGVFAQVSSTIMANSVTTEGNTGFGLEAYTFSYVSSYLATSTANTAGNYTPAVNVVGNGNSLITN
jgi:hypothetical protein